MQPSAQGNNLYMKHSSHKLRSFYSGSNTRNNSFPSFHSSHKLTEHAPMFQSLLTASDVHVKSLEHPRLLYCRKKNSLHSNQWFCPWASMSSLIWVFFFTVSAKILQWFLLLWVKLAGTLLILLSTAPHVCVSNTSATCPPCVHTHTHTHSHTGKKCPEHQLAAGRQPQLFYI